MHLFNRILLFCLLIISITYSSVAQTRESDELFGNAVEEFDKGNYHNAISIFEKVKAIDDATLDPESNRSGYADRWLAHCHYLLGDTVKAKEYSSLEYFFPPVDRRRTTESDSEGQAALSLCMENDFDGAIPHALRCLELEGIYPGRNTVYYVATCVSLSDIYFQKGDLDNATRYAEIASDILKELKVENTIYNFHTLNRLISVNMKRGMWAYATFMLPDFEKVARLLSSEKDARFCMPVFYKINARALVYGHDYDAAYKSIARALEGFIDIYTPDSNDCFNSIFECIDFLSMLNLNDLSAILVDDTYRRLDTRLSDPHRGVMLFFLSQYSADYEEGYRYMLQAAPLLKEAGYTDFYYENVCAIAFYHSMQGEIQKAIDTYRQVCDFYGENAFESGTCMKAILRIADLYNQIGYFEDASGYYEAVLTHLSRDKSDPNYILTFLKWLPVYLRSSVKGDFVKSFKSEYELGVEFGSIINKIDFQKFMSAGLGIQDIAYSIYPFFQALLSNAITVPGLNWNIIDSHIDEMLNNILVPLCSEDNVLSVKYMALLAHSRYVLGRTDEAVRLLNTAIDVCRRMDWFHEDMIHDLAYYMYDNGDTYGAYENFERGYLYNKENILRNFRWMTLEERSRFADAYRGNIDNMPHYAAITPDDRRYAALGYNALLFSKGLLLNSSLELTRLLREEGDGPTLELLQQWRDINMRIERESDPDSPEARRLSAESSRLEKALLEKSKTYGDYTRGLTVVYEDIQKALGPDDVAIEFFLYTRDALYNQYGALILTKNEAPRYVAVASDAEWRHIDLAEECYKSDELFNILFRNIRAYIPSGGKGKIYFAPAGVLHTVAVESLPGAEDYNLMRLSSTREIALGPDKSSKVSDMALFGGITYGIGDIADLYRDPSPYYLADNAKRESGEFLIPLPGTALEADEIHELMSASLSVDKFTGENATEECFKSLDGRGISIIHIGTHGYFRNDMSMMNLGGYNPLLSSGLYFAGAQNTLWDYPDRSMTEDGVLNAHEISMMDLRGLRLTVLSACETGRGLIGADGVFGLQRGFKQAGAQSILMSLWKVDDDATRMLMGSFYSAILEGMNQYDALKAAQKAVRKVYPDPQYWAAFIIIDADYSLMK